jgi:hypothetical protein
MPHSSSRLHGGTEETHIELINIHRAAAPAGGAQAPHTAAGLQLGPDAEFHYTAHCSIARTAPAAGDCTTPHQYHCIALHTCSIGLQYTPTALHCIILPLQHCIALHGPCSRALHPTKQLPARRPCPRPRPPPAQALMLLGALPHLIVSTLLL